VPIRGELDGAQPVVLVDNGNSTEIRAALGALGRETDRLAILRGKGNVGFSKGCNRGPDRAAQSHAPWIRLVELFRNAL
jgi:GT2 family glycosyltransferase